MGDFNLSGSTEAAYQTLTNSATPGAGVDPLNNSTNPTWSASNKTTAYKSMITESTQTTFSFRDDLELMTANVSDDTSSALDYIQGSEHVFGNDGTVAAGSTNYDPTGAYADIASDLETTTDHLPIVADFSVAVPEPTSLSLVGLSGLLLLGRRRSK